MMSEGAKKKNKYEVNLFRFFMLLWTLMLLLVVSDFLKDFYSFLENEEAKYRASLPETVTGELVDLFRSGDMGSISVMMKDDHIINEYETREDLNEYIHSLITSGRISAVPVAEETDDERQVYYIDSGDLRVARAEYHKEPIYDKKSIPVWDLVSLDVYADPSIDIRLSAPENVRLFINGRELTGAGTRTLLDPRRPRSSMKILPFSP